MTFTFSPIGVVRSCFTEKFGIPRQSGLAPLATASIELYPPFDTPLAFTGLDSASHLWVQFVFHQNRHQGFKPRVKPPRLGGNKTLGVFATRSPTRPNPIGLSVVKLDSIEVVDGATRLLISGHDMLDGTPVLDIKPYVPYTDAIDSAHNDFATDAPTAIAVFFNTHAEAQCRAHEMQHTGLRGLIDQLLQQDPRPQYQTPDPARIYGMRLWQLDVRWRYQFNGERWQIEVVEVVAAS
ncbi:MAG TPA: tRNA (N6-threonylcarbamoyladenosine(37)-N6)-methyltransferase TrmO [Cellvibrionaceae bacterium]